MWLARAKALNQSRILATQLRSLGFSARSQKWLSKKEANKVEEAMVGNHFGALDNPIYHTHTHNLMMEGDENQEFFYRERPHYKLRGDQIMATVLGTMFWSWVFYSIYWKYELLVGHWYIPYIPKEFTDEELGIPPDDAEDPEYWGSHGKKYGTYR
ncbi:unnamed protein product [Bursaphelenchus xylophilus]|uniref:(pine wood nematode) hypothetical protein n=1 Tax=Bursaphelenchus xylophilus TaxID=6326 RepID=A0A1I7SRW1_BURXY|nr:unnamed protein product [Bursaphelenchus xylophilus]CAG9101793.1 unnamed protein product [Bursaphelenchus xylophilus]